MRPYATKVWPKSIFGENASLNVGNLLKEESAESVLAVYDKGTFKAGIIQPILAALRASGLKVAVYDGVLPDPSANLIIEGTKIAREANIDALVGIGGGSSMDTAKGIGMYLECDAPLERYFLGAQDRLEIPVRTRKLILIPTTAGTGSEESYGAVITDNNGKKRNLRSVRLSCDYAILDPMLMLGLPPYLTLITACDALAHSIETMTGTLRSARSDMFCGQAIEYIWRSLPKALKNGHDVEARSELSIAANITMCSDGSRHIGHAIAHALGAKYHIAHGHACALVLPTVIRYVARDTNRELRLIAEKMRLDIQSIDPGEAVASAIEKFLKGEGLKGLREYGAGEDIYETIPEILSAETYMSHVDRRPDDAIMRGILKDILAGF